MGALVPVNGIGNSPVGRATHSLIRRRLVVEVLLRLPDLLVLHQGEVLRGVGGLYKENRVGSAGGSNSRIIATHQDEHPEAMEHGD